MVVLSPLTVASQATEQAYLQLSGSTVVVVMMIRTVFRVLAYWKSYWHTDTIHCGDVTSCG